MVIDHLAQPYKDQYTSNTDNQNIEYKKKINNIILHNTQDVEPGFIDKEPPIMWGVNLIVPSLISPTYSVFDINNSILDASINYENTSRITDINSIPIYMVVLCGSRKLAKHIVLSVILEKKVYTIGLGLDADLMSPDMFLDLNKKKNSYKILDIGIFRHKYALNLNTIISKYQLLRLNINNDPTLTIPTVVTSLKLPIKLFRAKRGAITKKTMYNYSRLYTGMVFRKNEYEYMMNCARFVVDILTEKSNITFIPDDYRLNCGIFENNMLLEPSDPFKCDTIPPFDERAPYIYILLNKLSKSSNESDYIEILENLIKLLDLKSYSHYIEHPFR
jgi:hypothetical protein